MDSKDKDSLSTLGESSTLTSIKETLFTGTRTEVPTTFPSKSGNTFPIDEEAPVVCGIILLKIERFVRLFE